MLQPAAESPLEWPQRRGAARWVSCGSEVLAGCGIAADATGTGAVTGGIAAAGATECGGAAGVVASNPAAAFDLEAASRVERVHCLLHLLRRQVLAEDLLCLCPGAAHRQHRRHVMAQLLGCVGLAGEWAEQLHRVT